MALALSALKLLSKRDKEQASKLYSAARHVTAQFLRVEGLESRQLLSTSWFVSPAGSNNNAGTLNAPFQSIQQAANMAQTGDSVEIETGTYHETVTPAHSGVTFEAYNGENVTVSGADPISGWSDYSGSIYQASMPTDLGEGNNQVFVNGVAMIEADFPNTPVGGLSHPNELSMTSVKGNTIYNSSLSQPANYWKGAIIQMAAGQAWDGITGTVTSSAPGSITISYQTTSQYNHITAGNTFRLFGVFHALDSAGEWYRDPSSGKLYLWAPNGASPGGQDVEAKVRQYAFDLRNVSGTTIHGVNIFASTIITGSNSSNTVINGITAQYVSQLAVIPQGWYIRPTQGIMLMGNDSVLENSTIAWSTGPGVLSRGTGNIIRNNVIHDTVTSGGNTGAVQITGTYNTVDHNTIYNSGRHGILAEVTHATITYNTIHDIGLQTTEAGGIYTANVDGVGCLMAFNDVYNIHTGGYGGTALFLDNDTSGWTVHNNITSNVDYAMKMNFTSNNNIIYNNTMGATKLSINSNQQGNWDGVKIYNNVFSKPIVTTGGAQIYNNVFAASSTGSAGAGDFSSGASGTPVATPPSGSSSGGSSTAGSGSGSTSGTTGSGSGSTDSSSGTTDPAVGSTDPGSTDSGSGAETGTITPPVALSPAFPAGAHVVMPATGSTVAELTADVAADRSALSAAIVQKKATLHELAATHQGDVAAYQTVLHELSKARRKHSAADIATFTADAAQLSQTVKSDLVIIVADHKDDFAGITGAHDALAVTLKDLRFARHAK